MIADPDDGRVPPERVGASLVGVDVGGTFTDLLWLDGDGRVRLAKVPTTPRDQSVGVLDALAAARVDVAALDLVVHGTTTTTNAVLERRLARTGLITTRGFRDVLELGRRTRPAAYGMRGVFVPIIPRDLRLEVDERVDAAGETLVPLDEDQVAAAARCLEAAGCESVVVHFLHAYANPAHERRAAEIVRALCPGVHVGAAHELLGESREFERGVTAAVNAGARPLLERYLGRLVEALAARGYAGDTLVVAGNGGMVAAPFAAREAARSVMSGPASGVMAAAWTGRRANRPNLITYDMGGTSTDVALIRDAEPAVSAEIELEHGLPIHVPLVDVRTVGAGGGSIARVTAGGLLAVGPESAGALPGPICYGRGGTRPTLSDASFLLGRLDPSGVVAGREGGDAPDAARRTAERLAALRERVAEVFAREIGAPLGLDATAAAAAVVRVASARTAGAVRMVSVSLGADPRDFALFAFGGAGPLHAVAIARELGIPEVLVPPRPGITNAIGCAVAALRHDLVNTLNRPLAALDIDALHALIARQVADGEALLARQRLADVSVRHTHALEMQFVGQTHLLRVPLDSATPSVEALGEAFERVYRERFRVVPRGMAANLVNVATSVIGERPPPDLSTLIDPGGRAASVAAARLGGRPVHVGGRWRECPVYRRERLPLDARIEGPAVVEQMDATLLLGPTDVARGDAGGNLLVTVGAGR